MAQQITGQSATPTACQGGTSYTVEGGVFVVQFRAPYSPLDMALIQIIEQALGFAPRHEYRGRLDQLHVYVMNNMGGKSMYMARIELQVDDYRLLRVTIDDYASCARDFLSASTRRWTVSSPQLPDLFAEDWPLVPNHLDLFENNIHVDTATGKIAGICDWRSVEISPFGMSLGFLEIMLGTLTTTGDGWRYHPNHGELRDQFWATFYKCLGGASDEQKRRIEAARRIGLFLANGFQNGHPATEESEDLRFLGAVILN
ncbi:hypothetical protein SCUCBS95973_009968 [Sporothrix curviconia]|uniref:Aminoglycoside phosphotransferase domain-containing protein n=1 Tax=Sporothrix curviconia TaxID=1260050 RepID=A0ABP0CZA2_9PEZI